VVPGLRREHISRSELMEQLRLKGVDSLAKVKRAYLESTGEFSVIQVEVAKNEQLSTLEEESSKESSS
jgi:uncharacterized membrane protein YcaP (DUF421 family)